MITATEPKPVVIPASIRNRATRLIADLGAVAGDDQAVFDELEKHMLDTKEAARMAVMFAALGITFGECITDPTESPDNPVPVTWPDTNEGEQP